MKCSEMKPLIYPLVDNELDNLQRKSVLEHIIECHNCREEYELAMDMKAMIASHIIVDDLEEMIKTNNTMKNWRERLMRKPLAVAIAASIMILAMVVPVYGQDMLSTIQAWVGQFDLSMEGADYQIRTDLIGETDPEEQPSRAMEYSSLDWAMTAFEFPVIPPRYLPDGYSFHNVETYEFDEGATNLLVIKYWNKAINDMEPSLSITYEFITQEIVKRDIRYSEGTKVKEAEVNGNSAIFHKKYFSAGCSSVGLDIILGNDKSKMLRISMLVEKADFRNNLPAIEEDLIAIAKSIIQ